MDGTNPYACVVGPFAASKTPAAETKLEPQAKAEDRNKQKYKQNCLKHSIYNSCRIQINVQYFSTHHQKKFTRRVSKVNT